MICLPKNLSSEYPWILICLTRYTHTRCFSKRRRTECYLEKQKSFSSIMVHQQQGFRLRPEAGRFLRSFSILCPVLWWKFLRFFYLFIFYYHFFLFKQHMNLLPFPASRSNTTCPISLQIFRWLFKENLCQLQPCTGNWFRSKQRFWSLVSKWSPRSLRLA